MVKIKKILLKELKRSKNKLRRKKEKANSQTYGKSARKITLAEF